MDKGSWTPPGFLSEDTSHSKLQTIPYLNLGLPYLYRERRQNTFFSVIRPRDVSGNVQESSKRKASHIEIVIRKDNTIKISPSSDIVKDCT